MSRAGRIPRGALAAAALAATACLCACGFAPLYAQPGVTAGLTRIQVDPPKGRLGYLLAEDLNDSFGRAFGEPPAYRLELDLRPTRSGHGVTANDTAQRYELDLKVIYTLVEAGTGKVAHTGTVYSNISYDSVNEPYAGIQARNDVQDRLASDVAAKMQTQIAAFLATRHTG